MTIDTIFIFTIFNVSHGHSSSLPWSFLVSTPHTLSRILPPLVLRKDLLHLDTNQDVLIIFSCHICFRFVLSTPLEDVTSHRSWIVQAVSLVIFFSHTPVRPLDECLTSRTVSYLVPKLGRDPTEPGGRRKKVTRTSI